MTFETKYPFVKLADVVTETQYGTSKPANGNGGRFPILRMNNITYSGHLDLSDIKRIDVPDADIDKYTVKRRDLLFNRTNSRELVGKTAVWDRDAKYAFAGYLIRVRFDESRVVPEFISAYLNSQYGKAVLFARCKPSVNMSNISATELLRFEVPLPPLTEQKRIADILGKADAIRRKRQQAHTTTSALIESVYRELFGDPATNSSGWPTRPLKSLVSAGFQNGAYYKKSEYVLDRDSGTQMVHMSDAFYGTVDLTGLKCVNASPPDITKYRLTENDLLVARRSLNYEGAAKPCRIPATNDDLIFESSLIRVTPDRTQLLPLYLHYFLLDSRARAQYVFPHVTRSTISGINQAGLGRVPIVLPPLELQQEFVSVHSQMEEIESKWATAAANADDLFNSLVQRAFKGEL